MSDPHMSQALMVMLYEVMASGHFLEGSHISQINAILKGEENPVEYALSGHRPLSGKTRGVGKAPSG